MAAHILDHNSDSRAGDSLVLGRSESELLRGA